MTRVSLGIGLLVACLPGAVLGGAAVGGGGVHIDDYDEAGNLRMTIEAEQVKPAPENPKVLEGTNVRLTNYYKGMKHVITAKQGRIDPDNRSAALHGEVVIALGDEQGTRLETERLYWLGEEGVATTEPPRPDVALEQAMANPQTPVTITRVDMVTEGIGLQLWLRDVKGASTEPGRTDHLVIGKRVRTVLRTAKASWLLRDTTPREPKAKEPGGSQDAKQDAEKKAKARPADITITCSGPLSLSREDLTAAYHGNVRAVQGEQSLTCDKLTITVVQPKPDKEAPKGDAALPPVVLDRVTAAGNVRIDNAATIAQADLAVWHQRDGLAMLTGRPARVTWDNGNEIRAGRIRRMQDGNVLDCSATAEYPECVYLFAFPTDEQPPAPQENKDAPTRAAADR